MQFGSTTLIPQAGFVYDFVKIDGYTDSCANRYEGFGKNILQATTGLRVVGDYKTKYADVKPFIAVTYATTLSDTEFTANHYSNVSQTMTSFTDRADKWRFIVDAGVIFVVGPYAEMRLAYIGSFGEMTTVNGGTMTFKVSDIDTEFTASYSNSYGGSKSNIVGDYSIYSGVNIRY